MLIVNFCVRNVKLSTKLNRNNYNSENTTKVNLNDFYRIKQLYNSITFVI